LWPEAGVNTSPRYQEVQPDVAEVSGALGELRTAFEVADYQLPKLPPAMLMKLQSPPVQQAIDRIEQFSAKAC